jgi:peptidoglycan-associated lipoprotein
MKVQNLLLAIGSVVILALPACSTKGGMSTTGGSEAEQMASRDGGRDSRGGRGGPGTGKAGEEGGSGFGAPGSGGRGTDSFGQPLTGFSKKPTEETVAGSAPPVMVSKADSQTTGQGMESREARKAREDGRRELADIYFAFDRWMLSDEGKKNLSQSARFLKDNPKVKLLIEGHCDERGSREYNLALGEKRAKEARQYLADLGISNPVAVTSYGKERPACSEHDEDCYSKNRRAHLLIEAGR